ncbi:hypothetical protein DFH08DRAFT_816065 [Mycena albidolilacea]|uniref:Uncharacterized protein n=1 Tax=Mycena albidolilacea TaxID=1033008 RepID=A0AAD6ZKZ4_9AGAR|nr:hypothetical protein DFH08DRAFT_816065 [Mycena albidolilacea]
MSAIDSNEFEQSKRDFEDAKLGSLLGIEIGRANGWRIRTLQSYISGLESVHPMTVAKYAVPNALYYFPPFFTFSPTFILNFTTFPTTLLTFEAQNKAGISHVFPLLEERLGPGCCGQDQSLTSWEGLKTHLHRRYIHEGGSQRPDSEGEGEVHFFRGAGGVINQGELTTSSRRMALATPGIDVIHPFLATNSRGFRQLWQWKHGYGKDKRSGWRLSIVTTFDVKEICRCILEHDGNGAALHEAVAGGCTETVDFLIQNGAENAKGGNFDSSLHAAAHYGHEAIIIPLISRGANIDFGLNVNAEGGSYGIRRGLQYFPITG